MVKISTTSTGLLHLSEVLGFGEHRAKRSLTYVEREAQPVTKEFTK